MNDRPFTTNTAAQEPGRKQLRTLRLWLAACGRRGAMIGGAYYVVDLIRDLERIELQFEDDADNDAINAMGEDA